MGRIEKAMRWLFPAHYAETAKCKWCRAVVSKTRMVHNVDGWFCNKEESDAFWWWRNTGDEGIHGD